MATETIITTLPKPPQNNENSTATPPPKTRFNSARAVFEKLSSGDNPNIGQGRVILPKQPRSLGSNEVNNQVNSNGGSPQHKVVSVRSFVNRLNSENGEGNGGTPPPATGGNKVVAQKPNVYKKPPELVAKRLGGGTAAGFVNGRELIEKQKNWTMHFKSGGQGDGKEVVNGGGKVNGVNGNGVEEKTKEVTKAIAEDSSPVVVSVSKLVLKHTTSAPTSPISEETQGLPPPSVVVTTPVSPQPPPTTLPPPVIVSPEITQQSVPPPLPPKQSPTHQPPPVPSIPPDSPQQQDVVLDPPSISITNVTSFSSTTEDEEMTTVIDCLGSTSSLLNGSCSSLNQEFEHGSGSISGELFKECGEEEFKEEFVEEVRKEVERREGVVLDEVDVGKEEEVKEEKIVEKVS